MKWNFKIDKDYTAYKKVFFEIINDFDSLGQIIFQERNTLRKIENSALGTLAVKSFKKPHFINQYIYTNLRQSKAYRSFYNAELLLAKNINTPKPLAYFEEKKNGKLIRSFYFSEFYAYDFTFRELIEKRDTFTDWEEILKAFTHFVFTIHEADILFKDLSPGNVLIKRTSNGYDFSLIDLNRMSFKKLTIDTRLQNFIRLSLTQDMIPIIGSKYALLTQQNKKTIINTLKNKNEEYIEKKERKKKLKKIIGKS